MEKLMVKETITSLELVEQINVFRRDMEGKAELRHDTLIRTIRDEFEEEIGAHKIVESNYLTSQNKKSIMFVLTLAQAKQVLMKESKVVRKAVISYIEELETKVKELQASRMPTLPEALRAWAEEAERRIELEEQARIAAPKVEYHDEVLSSVNGMTTTQVAKEYGWSAMKLNKILHELGVQFKQSGQWQLYAKYSGNDYMTTQTHTYDKNGDVGTRVSSEWTQIGRKFIHELLIKEGLVGAGNLVLTA